MRSGGNVVNCFKLTKLASFVQFKRRPYGCVLSGGLGGWATAGVGCCTDLFIITILVVNHYIDIYVLLTGELYERCWLRGLLLYHHSGSYLPLSRGRAD